MIACRFCGAELRVTFVDLGLSPLCESFSTREQLAQMEPFYPLHVRVCGSCFLVQLPEFVSPQAIFGEYAYFSSYSKSWVEHARRYVHMAIDRFGLGTSSRVIEVASNDGYLLQHFVARGVPVLGVEPAANVAEVARERGVPTVVQFLSRDTAAAIAREHGRANLVLGNNVLAHVPDINDFVAGLRELLAPGGVITMEFPHLQRLIEGRQFDTIYHEHFSYLSWSVVDRVFAAHGLRLFDVDELPTHGGSLRIYACHADDTRADDTRAVDAHAADARVAALRERERALGFDTLEGYSGFDAAVRSVKRDLLSFLIDAKARGKKVCGYGAPGKGNTLLNYCGIRTDFLDFTVDANPYKHGKFTPGTRIPILAPQALRDARPDYVLILPWNIKDEIIEQMSDIRAWGGQFVVPIPQLTVLP